MSGDRGRGARATKADPFWTEYAPLRRSAFSVFDNKVERASRERNGSGENPSDLTKLASASTSVGREASRRGVATAAHLFVPNKFQVSNESLILAQNQRWRRA